MDQHDKKIWSPHDRNAGAWVEADDSLYCAAYSSVASLTVSFAGYFRKANGEIIRYEVDVNPTSDRAVTAVQQVFGAGFLLSCAAYLKSGNADRGQCYVRAGIRKGSGSPLVVLNQILGGYTTDDFSPSFPHGTIQGPLEGPGLLGTTTIADPAVATDLSYTNPTGCRRRLRGLLGVFDTDANAGNRVLTLTVSGVSNNIFISSPTPAIIANSLYQISYADYGQMVSAIVNDMILVGLPPITLEAGASFVLSIDTVRAGDQLTGFDMGFEEWIEA